MAVRTPAKPARKSGPSRRWPPPQGEWTYDDYARLPDNGVRYEVIEGDLYMSPAPRPRHQLIIAELYTRFRQHIEQQDLGKIIFSPIDVNMPGFTTPVQPDLLFIARENLGIITETKIEGVPDLIVEVLSPGNPSLDRDIKFHVYARAGVREYWIVDPDACAIDVFVLRGQAYALLDNFSADQETRSEVLPDFALRVRDICST